MDVRAALLDKDVSRKDKLAVRPLRAKALGLGITAVRVEPIPFLCANSCRFILSISYTSVFHFDIFRVVLRQGDHVQLKPF